MGLIINSGYGDGYGSGYGYKLNLSKDDAWDAYHYIANGLIMRNGQSVKVGEHIHEDEIIMCQSGLHASLDKGDAMRYAPLNAVLTKVKVWGKMIIDKDKLVATDRMIVEVLQ